MEKSKLISLANKTKNYYNYWTFDVEREGAYMLALWMAADDVKNNTVLFDTTTKEVSEDDYTMFVARCITMDYADASLNCADVSEDANGNIVDIDMDTICLNDLLDTFEVYKKEVIKLLKKAGK